MDILFRINGFSVSPHSAPSITAMASFMNLDLRPSSSDRHIRTIANSGGAGAASTTDHLIQQQLRFSEPISRRSAILISSSVPFGLTWLPLPSEARERRNRKNIPLEDYATSPDGFKYYDLVEGKGAVAEKGMTVQVHFDCLYRGVTAVSSRESKLLAGNRSIAQPYEFKVGSVPGKERKREFVDNPNGLFSAQASPKPPSVMYTITEGMKVGGKRTVIVPPEAGYGKRGMNEIPPNSSFELNIELLQVEPPPQAK